MTPEEKAAILERARQVRAALQQAGTFSPGAAGASAAVSAVDRARAFLADREKAKLAAKEEIGKEAQGQPSVNPLERAMLSLSQKDQAVVDYYKKAGFEVAMDPELGLVVKKPGQKARPVDRPATPQEVIGGIIGAGTPLGPLAGYAAGAAPFSGLEGAGDVADLTGAAIEAAPGMLLQLATRGKGAALASAGKGAVGDIVGSALRQGAAKALLGEEITAGERVKSGAANVIGGLAGEGASFGLGKAAGAIKGKLGSKLAGEATIPELKAASDLGQRAGVQLTPSQMTLDADALGFESLLRQSPGVQNLWQRFGMKQIVQASRFAKSAIQRMAGDAVPAKEAGDVIASTLKRYNDTIDGARKQAFNTTMEQARSLAPGKVVDFDTLTSEIANLEKRGLDMGAFRRRLPKAKVVNTGLVDAAGKPIVHTEPPRLTIDEMREMFIDLTDMARGKPPLLASDRTTSQWMGSRLKKALTGDLVRAEKAGGSLGEAAGLLKQAREQYAVMSEPINDATSDTIRQILKLSKQDRGAFVPGMLLSKARYSDTQVAKVLNVLDKTDPMAGRKARRAMIDAALSKAKAGGDEAVAAGTGLTEKLAARKAFETGEAALTPAKTRAAIRDNFQRLSVAMGGDKRAMSDLRDIADIFDRIDASMGYMRGSPTAPLIMSDKVVGTLMNVLRHPVAAAEQAGVMAMKRNLTNAIMNPEARNILIGIGKAKPNVTAAALNGMAAKLTTILARDNALDEEPTE